MNAPLLEVSKLRKLFGSTAAVDDISFDLKAGEIVGLLGPNGAGKTTTIRMLIAILEPSAGSVVYFGKNLAAHRSEILEQVAFASTYTNVPLFLTVMENFRLHALLYGMQKPESELRIAQVLSQFQLEDLANKRINQISAGQRTRVMLSRAFLPHPKIALLDEPTASLDPEVANDVRSFIRDQSRSHGVSILFSSHNMVEVTSLCDRVIFLDCGRIVAEDTPQRLARSTPTTRIEFILSQPELATHILKRHQVERHGETYRLRVPESEAAPLIADLVQSGAEVRHLNISEPTLEDFFLRHARTRGSL